MIPGVTDRMRLPRLGVIRLGEKRTSSSGKEYPAKLDYFNLVDAPAVAKVFGDKPRRLFPAMLLSDEEEKYFPTARCAYTKTALFCRCSDGQTATRSYNPKDKQGQAYLESIGQVCREREMFTIPCEGTACWYFERGFCKNVGRLYIVLPTVPGVGAYQISTTSFNSMADILGGVEAIKGLTGGRVAGIPLELSLVPRVVYPKGQATTVYVLQIRFPGSMVELARYGRRLALGEGPAMLQLEERTEHIPDDLMPHGGEALERALAGAPPPRPAGGLSERLERVEVPERPGGALKPPPEPTSKVEAAIPGVQEVDGQEEGGLDW